MVVVVAAAEEWEEGFGAADIGPQAGAVEDTGGTRGVGGVVICIQ